MKKSEIHFDIQLDDNNIPDDITWNATDKPGDADHTKAISIAVWDDAEKNTMRLDLWTKDMPVHEMKKFYIDSKRYRENTTCFLNANTTIYALWCGDNKRKWAGGIF